MRHRHMARRPQARFDRMMNEFFSTPNHSCSVTSPKVNVQEKEDSFIMEVAAPGYSKESFTVRTEKDHLIISATVDKSEDESINYSRQEFAVGSFERRFHLGKSLDKDGISASYSDGILKVAIAKKVEVDDTKLIEIQ